MLPRCLLLPALVLTSLLSPAAAKPNVLFICVDDLKPILGCYGDKTVKSPHIDRLAARGLVFDNAYCNQAVCAPSRNSLLTGLLPSTVGIYDLGTHFRDVTPDAITFPQLFKQNGYHSAGVGKILHVGHGNHEDALSWSEPHWQGKSISYALPRNESGAGLTREEALFANKSAQGLPRGAAFEIADVPDNTYSDGRIAEQSILRLQTAKARTDTPFLLATGFLRPHLPFNAPKKYWDLYNSSDFTLAERRTPPDGAPSYAPQFGGELRQYSGIPEAGELPDDLQRTLIHGYHAAVSYMDAQLGRVLDELDRLGLTDNTIIVLWGDHGWHLGDHSMWCKHTCYEQAARIPLLIVAPGVTAPGTRSAAMVETVDLYPTVCELAGLPTPAGPHPLDGKSLVPVLKNPAATVQDHILHVYPRGPRLGRAIRTATHRLVEWKVPGEAPDTADLELYDYVNDPLETKNLAASQPDKVSALRALLNTYPEARPQYRSPAASRPAPDRKVMFEKRDTNHDGKLTMEEFLTGQPDPDKAPARFPRFDKNRDGVLTAEEFINSGK